MSCTYEIKQEPGNIGRSVVVGYDGKCYVATVIDLIAGTNRIKRVRIQRDLFIQGKVLMPGEYKFMEWADDD